MFGEKIRPFFPLDMNNPEMVKQCAKTLVSPGKVFVEDVDQKNAEYLIEFMKEEKSNG